MSDINGGWIKLYRKIWQNPIVSKDAETFMIWVYLLSEAAHMDRDYLFAGKRITVHAGELVTTVRRISEELHIDTGKINRTLRIFESEGQIVKRKSNQKSLIFITNWNRYQNENDKPMTNERQTSDNRMTNERQTGDKSIYNKNNKNNKNIKNTLDSSSSSYLSSEEGCEVSETETEEEKSGKEKEAVIEVSEYGDNQANDNQPTVDEVLEYKAEIHSQVDVYRFCDYYRAHGWMSGGNPICDWRAVFRRWGERQRASPREEKHETEGSFDTDEFFMAAVNRVMM